jgi:hypothetical protein
LEPIYALCRVEEGRDRAVLISRPGWDPSRLSGLTPADVVFVDAGSVNGCWLQLRMLEEKGFAAPRNLDALNFAPTPDGAPRVVFEVLMGGYTLGACRRSDLDELVEAGSLGVEELAVVKEIPALPELVVACRAEDREYFTDLFQRISVRLAASTRSDSRDVTAALFKACGIRSLRPVTSNELILASDLFAHMQSRNSAGKE